MRPATAAALLILLVAILGAASVQLLRSGV